MSFIDNDEADGNANISSTESNDDPVGDLITKLVPNEGDSAVISGAGRRWRITHVGDRIVSTDLGPPPKTWYEPEPPKPNRAP